MTSILDVVGAQTFNSFSDGGAGTDHVSRYIPRNRANSPITGAIDGGSQRPIMFRYIQIYNGSTSTGARDLQISTAASGSGGAQSASIAGSDNDPDWNVIDSAAFGPLQFACMSTDSAGNPITYYYGFYKNDGSRVYFYTGASASSSWNPVNVYTNGTISTAYPDRVIAGRIGWYHAPNAPTNGTQDWNNTTSSSIPISWTQPADDGISDSVTYGGIYGYRIAYKKDIDSTWAVYGSATTGSPSGTHYLVGAGGAYAGAKNFETMSGLEANRWYNLKVGGLNLVTDRHSGAAPSISAGSPHSSGTRYYGNYTSTSAHTGTNLDFSVRTRQAAPRQVSSYANTASVNASYSSSEIFTQDANGGANTNYSLSYSIASGSLPPGLTLSSGTISGTPTTPGTYTFTVSATNNDSVAATSNTQTITVGTLGPKVSPANGSPASTRSTAKVWNGTSFVEAVVKVYDGTTPYNANGWKYLR